MALAIAVGACLACQQQTAELSYVKYTSEADVPRMSIQDAKAAVDNGTAVIVDGRGADAYAMEHIKDSISVPLGVGAEDKFSTLPKGKKIIVYCSWPNEHTSASLAFQMNQKNIPQTYALLGGTNAWKTAGFAMEKAANP